MAGTVVGYFVAAVLLAPIIILLFALSPLEFVIRNWQINASTIGLGVSMSLVLAVGQIFATVSHELAHFAASPTMRQMKLTLVDGGIYISRNESVREADISSQALMLPSLCNLGIGVSVLIIGLITDNSVLQFFSFPSIITFYRSIGFNSKEFSDLKRAAGKMSLPLGGSRTFNRLALAGAVISIAIYFVRFGPFFLLSTILIYNKVVYHRLSYLSFLVVKSVQRTGQRV